MYAYPHPSRKGISVFCITKPYVSSHGSSTGNENLMRKDPIQQLASSLWLLGPAGNGGCWAKWTQVRDWARTSMRGQCKLRNPASWDITKSEVIKEKFHDRHGREERVPRSGSSLPLLRFLTTYTLQETLFSIKLN